MANQSIDSFKNQPNLDWPDKAGHYWFYGSLWRGKELELALAQCDNAQNGLILEIKGIIVWDKDAANGVFITATLPELPDLATKRK